MVVVGFASVIQTNTPQFQDYAFHAMFSQATNMAVKWNLDLPRPVTTNMVTEFKAVAYPAGIGGTIVFSNQFSFNWTAGGLPIFNDRINSCQITLSPDLEADNVILEKWMRATNLLTMETAQKVSTSTMRAAGLPLDKLKYEKPKLVHQRIYEWKNGKNYPLPYYHFRWETEESSCSVDVSGINGKVVYFSFTGYPYLRFTKPANYFQMLGLPTNAVFVHRYPTAPNKMPVYELREQPSAR